MNYSSIENGWKRLSTCGSPRFTHLKDTNNTRAGCAIFAKNSKPNVLLRNSTPKYYSSTASRPLLKCDNPKVQRYLQKILQEYQLTNMDNPNVLHTLPLHQGNLRQLSDLATKIQCTKQEIEELEDILKDVHVEGEMATAAKEELMGCQKHLEELDDEVIDLLVAQEDLDENDIIVEITAGVGGQEAMLFAADLLGMYMNFARSQNWVVDSVEVDRTELGGIRHGSISVRAQGAYRLLKYEAGVHRVQRVPKTEKSGRVHTSTAAVVVLPHVSEVDVDINPKDLKIETKRASGPGGQHVNKTESAVRLVHLPTGIAVESQAGRSQIMNHQIALCKLRALLHRMQYEEKMKTRQNTRKLQAGTSGRSEKIRTYNFMQDRLTDHRIGLTMHNLADILQGGDDFVELVQALQKYAQLEALQELTEV